MAGRKSALGYPANARRVTKAEWYDAGGFANSACWRRQLSNGAWQYFINR